MNERFNGWGARIQRSTCVWEWEKTRAGAGIAASRACCWHRGNSRDSLAAPVDRNTKIQPGGNSLVSSSSPSSPTPPRCTSISPSPCAFPHTCLLRWSLQRYLTTPSDSGLSAQADTGLPSTQFHRGSNGSKIKRTSSTESNRNFKKVANFQSLLNARVAILRG